MFMCRHDACSTMLRSIRPLQEWGKLFGEVPSATAILDRSCSNPRGVRSLLRAEAQTGIHNLTKDTSSSAN